jgi:hypothetical protein
LLSRFSAAVTSEGLQSRLVNYRGKSPKPPGT